MRMYDSIQKKKEGKILSTEEINYMIRDYTKGIIPDYQMSAMLMAICFKGMDDRETYDLTMAMRDSGEIMDLSGIYGLKADKHSTGGVGDKTTLVLAPILGALGLKVAKMSGRGLGHTGGIGQGEILTGFDGNFGDGLQFTLPFFIHRPTHGHHLPGELMPRNKRIRIGSCVKYPRDI